MNTAAVWLLIVVAGVAANLPFISHRLGLFGPRSLEKSLWWRLGELGVLYGLTLGLGFGLEARVGQVQRQGWEFYAATACMFLTLAFPGFAWRYLRRQSRQNPHP